MLGEEGTSRPARPACAGSSTRSTARPTSSSGCPPTPSRSAAEIDGEAWSGSWSTRPATRPGGRPGAGAPQLNGRPLQLPGYAPSAGRPPWSPPGSPTSRSAGPTRPEWLAGVLPRGAGHPALRFGRPRPVLGGGRPGQRVLRVGPPALGPGRRGADRHRGRGRGGHAGRRHHGRGRPPGCSEPLDVPAARRRVADRRPSTAEDGSATSCSSSGSTVFSSRHRVAQGHPHDLVRPGGRPSGRRLRRGRPRWRRCRSGWPAPGRTRSASRPAGCGRGW